MSAVSQSYPNYLGGLNEQPDELKKPGQLVEALNVIHNTVIGLTRRPGFELIEYTNYNDGSPATPQLDPGGTWFELELSNQVNNDYIYFGYVNNDGTVVVFNQDGETQLIKYTDVAIKPHQKYAYNSGFLTITDSNDKDEVIAVNDAPVVGYFKHQPQTPLKYCISKNHIIFTNPEQVPTLDGRTVPTDEERGRYYSFINLKVIDTANYDYTFRRFFADDAVEEYEYISEISLDSVEDLGDRYDEDTDLPLNGESYRFSLDGGPGITEAAVVEVTFRGQVVQLKSSDGDGFRNEARYTWSTKIINPGKGYQVGQVYREKLTASTVGSPNKPDLDLTFKITNTTNILGTKNVIVNPGDVSNLGATEILQNLAESFRSEGIDKAIVVGNGVYLENQAPFSVSTDEIAVADVINSQELEDDEVPIVRVSTVGELPVECYAGFIVEVTNSLNDQNNYYLEYKSESQSAGVDIEFTKSDGYWEEIAKPFEPFNPENATLPHMITVAKESDRDDFTFVVSPIDYEPRTAGTSNDNPSMFQDEAPITEVNYYKNRLFYLTSVGTIITSRAGEINNLFLDTAISLSLTDPIDLIANSNQRVPIHGSAVVNNGMVLFGDSEQYSVTTSNDVLAPDTASVTKISNYTFDPVSDPVYLGTNLAFISSGLSRFYEMTNVYDRGPVDINERSQQIQSQFSLGFNIPVSSREQSMCIIYKRYETSGSNAMYMYRFRQENSQESSQTAWVRWEVDEPVTYVSLPRDKMFVMLESGRLYRMQGETIEGLPVEGSILPPVYLDGYTDRNTGVEFETRIKFPTIYPINGDKADITANTTIHRLKLSTAAIGTYNLTIDRKGYDSYELLVEQTPADDGNWGANIPPLRGEYIETVPVYTRNHNLDVTMTTTANAPLALRSMTWEGDWNPPYYKRA